MNKLAETREPSPSPLDLASCDREPIHIPGSIQPHGILFALIGRELLISAVSANVATHLNRDPHTLLGTPLSQVLD